MLASSSLGNPGSQGVWERIWATVGEEFSDLGNAEDITRIVLRLLVALALGALLGYQRESIGAPAGLRTHMLVSLGCALFVLIPVQAGMQIEDVSRVLQGVTAGIGFLGAGAILKRHDNKDIHGLTTAASVWTTAAIGVAAGMGRESSAIVSAVFAFVILSMLRRASKRRDT
jgi:putative Mg2+ transporter-C (MgtC) family protein